MTSRYEVELAYRLLLGRDPEDEAVVLDKVERCQDLDDLRTHFLASEEYLDQLPVVGVPRHLGIEIGCDDGQLQALNQRTALQWSKLGLEKPYWGVLTVDDFQPGRIEESRESFYATGQVEIEEVLGTLPPTVDVGMSRVLELGCGVGRLTFALARHVSQVIGVDVSPGNLAIARERADLTGIRNCTLVELASVDEWTTFTRATNYDGFLSLLTLQHNAPPVQVHMLRAALEGVNGGGWAVFQCAVGHSAYSFSAGDFLRFNPDTEMDMHSVPMEVIFELIRDSGMIPRMVYRDLRADFRTHSYTFACTKSLKP